MSPQQAQAWTLQLRHDYDDICFQYKSKLKPPLVTIVEHTSFWGRWDPLLRCIEISEQLILTHGWDTVRNVLKHEMAHQVVSEVFGHDDATHGKSFQKACDLLGLPAPFRSATGDLPQESSTDRKPPPALLRKVEALLSLAQSDNQNEAKLAMQKAQVLLQKHHLKELPHRNVDDYNYIIIETHKKKINAYQSRICSLLTQHYLVDIVISELYDAPAMNLYKTIEILGTKENTAIAEYVYHYLIRTCEQLWKSHKKTHPTHAKLKRSFVLGLLEGFEQQLSTAKESTLNSNNDSKALMQLHTEQLKHYVNFRFPKLRQRGRSQSRFDHESFESGRKQGKNIVIRKGVTASGKALRRLLPGS